jgi:hypothetical protein
MGCRAEHAAREAESDCDEYRASSPDNWDDCSSKRRDYPQQLEFARRTLATAQSRLKGEEGLEAIPGPSC